MAPEVSQAVEEIRRTFDGHRVDIEEESQGGAYVIVHDLPIGPRFAPCGAGVGFLVPFPRPRAAVDPHSLDGQVRLAPGGPYPAGIYPPGITAGHTWRGKKALQVSRRSRRWNAAADTAALKLAKVLEW